MKYAAVLTQYIATRRSMVGWDSEELLIRFDLCQRCERQLVISLQISLWRNDSLSR